MVDVYKIFWLVVIAGVANMTPPLAAKLWPSWDWPIDGGNKWRGIRIFGDHKTWRGLLTGMVMSELTFLLLPKAMVTPIYFGSILGFGALAADAIKSFFKRRMKIESGKSWFPWDQIDWILGIIVVSWTLINPVEIGVMVISGVILHLLVKLIGFWLKVNESKI